MRITILLLVLLTFSCIRVSDPEAAREAEILEWQQQADDITIIRDTYGVAHVYGKTDADAEDGRAHV